MNEKGERCPTQELRVSPFEETNFKKVSHVTHSEKIKSDERERGIPPRIGTCLSGCHNQSNINNKNHSPFHDKTVAVPRGKRGRGGGRKIGGNVPGEQHHAFQEEEEEVQDSPT